MSMSIEKRVVHGRLIFVQTILVCAFSALLFRMYVLNTNQREFLQEQGDSRYLRVVSIPASRGAIFDRNGEPLALSTPVASIWVNPKDFIKARDEWGKVARLLNIKRSSLEDKIAQNRNREFVYLRRHITPELAEKLLELKVPGVASQREYHRYYPMGEAASHVLGFTNIDDMGQEGIELMLNERLMGTAGSKRVIKDRLGRIVENVESIRVPRDGENLYLSIDRRIQYLAYRELKAAVTRHKAKGGSVVVMDVKSGEILAMVNQPSFNPNNRKYIKSVNARNRAVTDVFEPGSTMKPFSILAALESGKYQPDTPIDTAPGFFKLASFTIRDATNYGLIDVATVIKKSSNVGASQIALSLESSALWDTYTRMGFGFETASGFPGESAGILNSFQYWDDVQKATLSYGYGLSVTPLQLTLAYAGLANNGIAPTVSFLKRDEVQSEGRVVADKKYVKAVQKMLESVTEEGGTALRAKVAGYKVAGKTGTVRKAGNDGYVENQYLSVFAGYAPASDPRLVMVTMIDQPESGDYYGGVIAAPVFSRVMAGALRLHNVAPDDFVSDYKLAAVVNGDQL